MAVWTTATRTFAAGEVLTAANLNAQLRDFANGFGAWGTYTPTLTQGVSTNITKTVNLARYFQVQKTCVTRVDLTSTGAGTAGSAVTYSLPVAAQAVGAVAGSGVVYDASATTFYGGYAEAITTTTVAVLASGNGNFVGNTPSFAVAASDIMRSSVTFEAA